MSLPRKPTDERAHRRSRESHGELERKDGRPAAITEFVREIRQHDCKGVEDASRNQKLGYEGDTNNDPTVENSRLFPRHLKFAFPDLSQVALSSEKTKPSKKTEHS